MYNIKKAVITCGSGCVPSQEAGGGGRGGRKTGSLSSVWRQWFPGLSGLHSETLQQSKWEMGGGLQEL